MMRTAYSITGIALTPLIRRWLKRRAQRGKEDAARMGERFGYASQPRPHGTLIWLHAASVGETQSVLTLVRALLAQHAAMHLLITTGTVTSAALVARSNIAQVIHQFVPIDTQPAVARFLQHWQPDVALWVESEFWPQLLWQTHDRTIPMLLINARLSADSAKGWARFPRSIKSLLGTFTTLYAGSADDAKRLTALGAKNVADVGNLKYDAAPLPVDHALLAELSAVTANRRLWVAASTHANEEQLVADAHQIIAATLPGLLTIIIPRHATRGDAIAADLRARGFTLAQRSKNEVITADTAIYLADTMGELGSFFRLSDMVFLGGSLIPHGGHNPLEPARLHCTMLTGPYTHNFASIMQHFTAANAIAVVADKKALAATLITLFADDEKRLAMAEKASQVVHEARGASDIILQQIDGLLKEATS